MPASSPTKISVRNRLFYIEFLAYFCGSVSRADLVNKFGISEPAATNDIGAYIDSNPEMLRYDPRKKSYVYGGARPIYTHDVDFSLYELCGVREGFNAPVRGEPRIPSLVNKSIKRAVSVDLAAAFGRSICRGRQVLAEYFSQSSGSRDRNLSPLALVHDGARWHIRCYDHEGNAFKDYNLARFHSIEDLGASSMSIENDEDWKTTVEVKLIAHPKAEHPETIEFDHEISDGPMVISMGRNFVGYFLRHWHVDYSRDCSANPRSHQLWLSNRDELLAAGVSDWTLEW